jgi:hypothetical protein
MRATSTGFPARQIFSRRAAAGWDYKVTPSNKVIKLRAIILWSASNAPITIDLGEVAAVEDMGGQQRWVHAANPGSWVMRLILRSISRLNLPPSASLSRDWP